MCTQLLSYVRLFAIPWNVALQGPLSMEFSMREYWSQLPFPSPGDLPNPGIKPVSFASPALAGRFSTTVPPWEALTYQITHFLIKGCNSGAVTWKRYTEQDMRVGRRASTRFPSALLFPHLPVFHQTGSFPNLVLRVVPEVSLHMHSCPNQWQCTGD